MLNKLIERLDRIVHPVYMLVFLTAGTTWCLIGFFDATDLGHKASMLFGSIGGGFGVVCTASRLVDAWNFKKGMRDKGVSDYGII